MNNNYFLDDNRYFQNNTASGNAVPARMIATELTTPSASTPINKSLETAINSYSTKKPGVVVKRYSLK